MYRYVLLFLMVVVVGCNGDAVPKPKAYLSLQYPEKTYEKTTVERPYVFDIPSSSIVQKHPKNWLKITYPKLKASVDITYRPVKENLKELLMEADKLVFEHTIKADNISSRDYANDEKRVYGKLYDISGNAASQVQFHVTDSAKHFLKASLFFYSKPNYDSVLPAVDYIKQDMIRMMESLEWNE